ncbi:Ig-like domain-containing protein [Paenibacillus marinisediminis]
MNVRRKTASWFALLLVITLIVGVLPFNGVAQAAETVINVEFENQSPQVDVVVEDQSVQLKLWATIKEESGKRDVTGAATWTSSNPNVVTVENGWVKGVGEGKAEITAKYQSFTLKKTVVSKYMYDTLVVQNAESNLEVAAEQTLQLGMKPEWKAIAKDTNPVTEDDVTALATWTSSNTEVADVSKGKVTLKSKGKADITVKYKGMSKTIKLTVGIPYDEIKITPNKLLEFEYGGAEQQLAALVKQPDGAMFDVADKAEWSSSDNNVVEVKNGKVKPINVGTATITVSYLGRTDSITAVVRSSFQAMRMEPSEKLNRMIGDPEEKISTYVIKKNEATGQLETIDVSQEAEWTSSNVMAVTVDKGIVRFKGAGTSTITASYKGLTKSIEVTVYPIIKDIEWKDEKTDKNESGIRELGVYVDDIVDIPVVMGVTLGGDKVDVSKIMKWTSSDEDVVTIDDGKIKALKRGEAQLVGVLDGKTMILNVKVNRKALIMQANVDELKLVTGKESELPTVTVIYTDGEEQDVTKEVDWESTSPNLLVLDDKLKALVAGKMTLNGTFSNVKLSLKVTIEEAVVSYEIAPQSIYTNVGKSETIKVTGKYKNGKTVSLGSKIDWKVENEKIATVKGSSVKGVSIGNTKLVGEYQGTKLEIPVYVKPKLLKIEANPSSIKLGVGQSATWKVSAIYDTGEVVDVTSKVVAVPSSTKIKVSPGNVQGVSAGSGSIKITFDGKTTTLRVTVK